MYLNILQLIQIMYDIFKSTFSTIGFIIFLTVSLYEWVTITVKVNVSRDVYTLQTLFENISTNPI